ncbi:MAG: exodeoxyribonuclease VII small subunit [Campylobacterales bacterium]
MINFEDKIKHSKEILEKLMNPEITLEESMKLYKEGMDEIKAAQKLLDDAKIEYEEIKKSFEAKDEA